VRNCLDFKTITSAVLRASLRLEREVTGYRDDDGYTDHVKQSGVSALAAWDAEAACHAALGEAPEPPSHGQACNVIDSECTRGATLLPSSLAHAPGSEAVSSRLRLAYVLSPVLRGAAGGSFGALHRDPPMGGGWQWLCVGKKLWHCVDEGPKGAEATQRFSRAECRKHSVPPDMAAVALTARVLTATISSGDFLSFPVHWAHAVATQEASMGLSGYHSQT